MLAPSETTLTPFSINFLASSPLISFYVAHGRAMSPGIFQGFAFGMNCALEYFLTYSEILPLLTSFKSITNFNFSRSIPSGSQMHPLLSESVMGIPPKSIVFSVAYQETFPEPEIKTFLPSQLWPACFNMLSAKYTQPYPVASGLIKDPPHSSFLPVKTPVNSLVIFLYIPHMKPISRPPTPISPAGTSVNYPMCLNNSCIKAWQKFCISSSVLPLGSTSEPPLPPPIGKVVSEFLKHYSKAKNFSSPRQTEGWKRQPPLQGPIAELNWILQPVFTW